NAEPVTFSHSAGVPWWLIVAVLVLAGGVIYMLIKRKKKRANVNSGLPAKNHIEKHQSYI
ncbi:LPXTG cell wall anchor domain-containing protein, partial [Agriterribacter sp.]